MGGVSFTSLTTNPLGDKCENFRKSLSHTTKHGVERKKTFFLKKREEVFDEWLILLLRSLHVQLFCWETCEEAAAAAAARVLYSRILRCLLDLEPQSSVRLWTGAVRPAPF